MVWPVVVADPVAEVALPIVSVPFRGVDDPVFVAVSLIQICRHFFNGVTVHGFNPARRVRHCDNIWCYVSQV